MEINVSSKYMIADLTTALDVTGREHLVIVAKASWTIPNTGQRPRPIMPAPFSAVDVFIGDPGGSPMRYGSDFARYKPRCDVLFDSCAHAPNGTEVSELTVACQVGAFKKGMRVFGKRHWRKRLGMYSLSTPAAFTTMPLHYGHAFGGTRQYLKGNGQKRQHLTEAMLENPSGIGWGGRQTSGDLEGQEAPNLEALDECIRSPNGDYSPIAFSAVARHWFPRTKYAGTYDDEWLQEICPFLPEDFDEQYNQCAPLDQQIPFPMGGEDVVLRNMVANREYVRFKLPQLNQLEMRLLRKDYSVETFIPVVDTLYFETEKECFSVIWRVSVPIRRRIQEFSLLAIGAVNSEWWANKRAGRDSCAGCSDNTDYEESPDHVI